MCAWSGRVSSSSSSSSNSSSSSSSSNNNIIKKNGKGIKTFSTAWLDTYVTT